MSSVLDVFKPKSTDLEAVYKSWPEAPYYKGHPKKDGPIDIWLAIIKEGCKKRKVPKSLWPVVGEHYLKGKAKDRYLNVQKVMRNMHQGKYDFTWKRFKVAMRNMAWELPTDITQSYLVSIVSSGAWWIVDQIAPGKKAEDVMPPPTTNTPFLVRTLKGFSSGSSSSVTSASSASTVKPSTYKAKPEKSEESSKPVAKVSHPGVGASKPSNVVWKTEKVENPNKWSPKKLLAGKVKETKETKVPVWLLHVCHALDSVTEDHPKTISVLGAVILSLGAIPAMPAVQAGACGALLASPAAQVIGTAMTGVGSLLTGTGCVHASESESSKNGDKKGKQVAKKAHDKK
ncbi:hypothetical protein K474DRAFT_1670589 [Panus rudis PR-1116 ss-1]|nr:hypothetical protein K474DRAFT_1670589 [Panus rudis PR-1116 ss-1]